MSVTRPRLLVQMNHSGAGFFVYPQYVMNGILWAESHPGFINIPIVDFGEMVKERIGGRLHYNPCRYYDKKTGGDVFHNYFNFYTDYDDTDYSIHRKTIFQWRKIHNDRLGVPCIQTYPHGRHDGLKKLYDTPYNQQIDDWYHTRRKLAWRLLSEYFTVRDDIKNNIDIVWNQMFTDEDYVIGVHIRGTDKKANCGGRKITPDEYVPYIDHLIGNANKPVKIFLATDDPSYYSIFNNMYPGITRSVPNIQRSEKNIFLETDKGDNYLKGLDVLTDSLCLSKCNHLIKCSSAVSEFAIYFNKNLHDNSYNLQYDCSNMI